MNQNKSQNNATEIKNLNVAAHQQANVADQDHSLADLEPGGDVVGGLLPAVQKVREAANRTQAAHGSGGGAGKVSMQDIHFTF